jgi:hypothetical protein
MRVIKLFICIIILALVISPVAAEETLIQSIVKYRDFFVQLDGYSDCLLCDIESLERGKSIGVILLSPEGFEQHMVFDVGSMKPVYANARILNKTERNFLVDTSIRMVEVKKLAESAKMRAAELQLGWEIREGKPGNIIAKNKGAKKNESKQDTKKTASKIKPAELTAATTPVVIAQTRKKGHISNISKEIENEVATMSTKEILERFRAEVKSISQSERIA